MERDLMEKLVEWKQKKRRKPLIIEGARQVGKTWLMKTFGNLQYEQVMYINFDSNREMELLFKTNLDIKRIMRGLELYTGVKYTDKTLIIFDEIQETPMALKSLKYFFEDAPTINLIAAGSFLGLKLHQGNSFPVGKVEYLILRPMTLLEFMKARGKQQFVDLILANNWELITPFHEQFVTMLREYYYVGGMPEAVFDFIEYENLDTVRKIQNELLVSYKNDCMKYAPSNQVTKIIQVFENIPTQLAKENKKFVYGAIKKGGRAREFDEAINWLENYGLVSRVYNIKNVSLPLMAHKDVSAFKLYFLDIGLLGALTNISMKVLLEGSELFTQFKGALTEQYVMQELISKGHTLFYWTNEKSTNEVDFILEKNEEVIPIEVKATVNLQAKSLYAFVRKYHNKRAYRLSLRTYEKREHLFDVPLYAVAGIKF